MTIENIEKAKNLFEDLEKIETLEDRFTRLNSSDSKYISFSGEIMLKIDEEIVENQEAFVKFAYEQLGQKIVDERKRIEDEIKSL